MSSNHQKSVSAAKSTSFIRTTATISTTSTTPEATTTESANTFSKRAVPAKNQAGFPTTSSPPTTVAAKSEVPLEINPQNTDLNELLQFLITQEKVEKTNPPIKKRPLVNYSQWVIDAKPSLGETRPESSTIEKKSPMNGHVSFGGLRASMSVRNLKDVTETKVTVGGELHRTCNGLTKSFSTLCQHNKAEQQYRSLPRIILNHDDETFSVLYKASSQTNLSRPESEYKIPLTVHQPNRTIRTIMIDEFTTVGQICQLLTARNFLMPSVKFSLVEKIPHLKIERNFEDDECPISCLMSYKDGVHTSLIFFEDRDDKYGIFTDPKKWLGSSFQKNDQPALVTEIFSGPVPQLPTFRAHLFYRMIQKKTWHRRLCILRNSGLYACKKTRSAESSDLELIISLHPSLHLYTTTGGWTQYKSPTPYGFCLKTYGEQNPKYICYFCALTEPSLRYWSSLFRIAMKGRVLLQNYKNQMEFVSETLESFQEQNLHQMHPQLSRSIGCVSGRSDIETDL